MVDAMAGIKQEADSTSQDPPKLFEVSTVDESYESSSDDTFGYKKKKKKKPKKCRAKKQKKPAAPAVTATAVPEVTDIKTLSVDLPGWNLASTMTKVHLPSLN